MRIKWRLLNCLCSAWHYYANTIFIEFQLKQLIFKTAGLGNSKMWFTIFAPSKLRRCSEICPDSNLLNTNEIFKVLISPSILKIQRRQTTFSKANKTFSFYFVHYLSFITYRKSETIFKSSLDSHVHWDTL